MRQRASVWLQYLLPQRLLSRAVYHLARCRRPWLKDALIGWFARRYGITLAEAEKSRLTDYGTFNEFFTRALRPDARPLAAAPQAVLAPVDGRVSQCGRLQDDTLLQAKGLRYTLGELLAAQAGDPLDGLRDGWFATFYLAPQDYHRVHMPVAGSVRGTVYVPGQRFSVAEHTVQGIPGLFCRNERAICWFDCAFGAMALVLVGALNVSSITTGWLGEIASGTPRRWPRPEPERHYARGTELGRFNLGSTVIVVLPAQALRWHDTLATGAAVRMGQAIGTLTH